MPKLEGTSNQDFIGAVASADAVGSSKAAPKASRTGKSRKFYIVRSQLRSSTSGFQATNEDELFRPGASILLPPGGRTAFRDFPVTPIFLANERRGRIDRDFEVTFGYWLINDRMKAVLEQVDPGAFGFLKCDTKLPDGTDGPRRWLCEVVRVLEALDEERSIVTIETADNGSKVYNPFGCRSLIFDQHAVGRHHVFRMKYFEPLIICDEEFYRACKANKFTGLNFSNAAEGMI